MQLYRRLMLLSVMLRAYAHNLRVGRGESMWDLERGALIFIQNIEGGIKIKLVICMGGGALKTYFDNRSGLEKFLKE